MQSLSFVWLEITGKCQLACEHCYADSGPVGTHGTMATDDWRRVIDQAAALGVSMVQFIGGEPTLHPDLAELIEHALSAGVEVEVFSNLVHVSPALWEAFSKPGVRLATSYYSDDATEHAAITGRVGSHARTRSNVAEAVRRSIPLRTGVIDLRDGQRVDGALTQLRALGVTEINTDRLRQVGRGQRDAIASVDQLCGKCAAGVLAVAPDGTVWPCVFSRWLPVGNVRTDPLAAILTGRAVRDVRAMLTDNFAHQQIDDTAEAVEAACNPDCRPSCGPSCNPQCGPNCAPNCHPRCTPSCHPSCQPACAPNCPPRCSPACSPCAPSRRCWPSYR